MGIIDTNIMFSATRLRMKWTQSQMLERFNVDDSTLRRLERKKRGPKTSTLDKLPNVVKQTKTLSISFLLNQPLEIYRLCKALDKALEFEDVKEAARLFGLLEEVRGMDLPLNRHYCLAQKALLMLLQKADEREILPIIEEGLRITDLDPFNFEGEPLIYQEPRLLLALAQVYVRMGDTTAAVKLLMDINRGIDSYPYDDETKDRIVAPVLLALARLQLETHNYQGALAACTEGMEISIKWSQSRHFPDFLFVRSLVQQSMGDESDTESYQDKLTTAYAGFLCLGNTLKTQAVLETARDVFGINLELHGADDVLTLGSSAAQYESKMPKDLPIYDLGTTIRILREAAGLTLKELSKGICSFTTLSRIECGETQNPDFYTVEAITQRLGIHIVGYLTFYLSNKELTGYEMRSRVQRLLRHRRFDEAEILLSELEERTDYKKGMNLQYVETARATIFGEKIGKTPEYLKMLYSALKRTIPNFEENDVSGYHLTLCEATIVNQIAGYYLEEKNMRKSSRIYDDFLTSIKKHWNDEVFLAKFFATASFNYSTCLGRMNDREEALKIVDDALAFEQQHLRLVMFGELLFNKAYSIYKHLNKKKESLPLFVLSFYMLKIFKDYGRADDLETVRTFIFDEFGVVL